MQLLLLLLLTIIIRIISLALARLLPLLPLWPLHHLLSCRRDGITTKAILSPDPRSLRPRLLPRAASLPSSLAPDDQRLLE